VPPRLSLLQATDNPDMPDRSSGPRRPSESGAVDVTCLHLSRALDAERALIDDLRQALLRQRAGIAADDSGSIEVSAQIISRLLVALADARHRRTQLLTTLTGGRQVPLAQLEAVLGRAIPPVLQESRDAIRGAAEAVAREVSINQHVLRKALEAGDAFLQRLFASSVNPMPVYAPAPAATPHGVLINQRA
jgi:hypothetical protein